MSVEDKENMLLSVMIMIEISAAIYQNNWLGRNHQ